MKTTKNSSTSKSENLIKDVRRNTKRIFSSEQKTIIIMEGIRGEMLVLFVNDYSRYTVHWELCSNMAKEDVKRSIEVAVIKAGVNKQNPPKLLSDNGPCYIAKELEAHLRGNYNIKQIHGAPLRPQTQGKIERYHRSMKNRINLHNYYSPSELDQAIGEWVEYYNNCRYHESLDNLTPADVYDGRGEQILELIRNIKLNSLENRRINYHKIT